MHKEYRMYIKEAIGTEASDIKRMQHRTLSKFTHRTYQTLLYGYLLGADKKIVYDYKYPLVGTVAMYYAILGSFGAMLIENLHVYVNLDYQEIHSAVESSMEEFQIQEDI